MTTTEFLNALNQKPAHATEWIKRMLLRLEVGESKVEVQGYTAHTVSKFPVISVSHIKKFDIVYVPTFGRNHYILVHKVKNNTVYGLVFTSREACWTMMEMQGDRKFKGSFISNTYHCFPAEECLDNFVAVYEDKKEANKAFKTIKDYLKTQLGW